MTTMRTDLPSTELPSGLFEYDSKGGFEILDPKLSELASLVDVSEQVMADYVVIQCYG